jgi:hypothetical protein
MLSDQPTSQAEPRFWHPAGIRGDAAERRSPFRRLARSPMLSKLTRFLYRFCTSAKIVALVSVAVVRTDANLVPILLVGAGNSDLCGHPLADGVRGQLSRQPRDHVPESAAASIRADPRAGMTGCGGRCAGSFSLRVLSRGEVVFVDDSAEPVAPTQPSEPQRLRSRSWLFGWRRFRERRPLLERAVRPVLVVCAGINRHGEGVEGALHRRSSDPRWPRVMRWRSRGRRRSVDRGTRRLGY